MREASGSGDPCVPTSGEAPSPSERESIVVLAVDDNKGDLALVRHYLKGIRRWDTELLAFTDPAEAIAALSRKRVDVMLVDYRLGAENGLEVIQRIGGMGLRVPAILMTSQGAEELAVEALHAGVSDYLPKHVLGTSSLGRSISNAIQKHRLAESVLGYERDLERTVLTLRKKNAEIQGFYHTLSHELKTPLTAMREFVSIVLDGLAGPLNAEQAEHLTTAKRNCDQIVVCVNDILDVSRLETGKLSLQPRSCSVADFLERIVDCKRAQAQEAGLTLGLEVEGDPTMFVDEQRMTQVLNNLLSNAFKFTDHGGSVAVGATSLDEDVVEVFVRDTGRGIAPESLECVFDRLYQVSEGDAALHGGLGLGLNLCREIVRLSGGDIRAESKLGAGSTFTFTVPTHPDPDPAPPPTPTKVAT